MLQIPRFKSLDKVNKTDLSILRYPVLAGITGLTDIASKEYYSNYFFIECVSISNTCKFIPNNGNKMQYSRNGLFWEDFTNVAVELKQNERIYLKGSHMISDGESKGIGEIYLGINAVNIGGNIMSLLFGEDDFDNIFDISEYKYAFYGMFTNSPINKIYEGLLPATTLSEYCYCNMFKDVMFYSRQIPKNLLPAQKVCKYSYSNMFSKIGASSYIIEVVPDLPATELDEGCYEYMFSQSYIKTAPETLPAKHLPKNCYCGMFGNCQYLITGVMNMAAESISYSSCYSMYEGCTKMTQCCTTFNLPVSLPAYCMNDMFNTCNNLVASPYLNIKSIGEHSITGMFTGCNKLTGMTMLATTRYSNYRSSWIPAIKAPFYKHPQVKTESNLSTVLAEQVPSKWHWEIQPVGTILSVRNLTISPQNSSIVATATTANICYKYLCDVEYEGVTYTDVECYGPGVSEEFQPNETSDAIERTISFTYKGMTATTTITHNGVA